MIRERDIEKAFVERVKAMGGEVRKVSWTGRKSAPDRVAMFCLSTIARADKLGFHRLDRTVWVELKRPGQKPRPDQLREHTRMRNAGQTVYVISTYEELEQYFPEALCLNSN